MVKSPGCRVLGVTRPPLSGAFSVKLHEIHACQAWFFTYERLSSINKSHLEEEKLPALVHSQEVESRYEEVSEASSHRSNTIPER